MRDVGAAAPPLNRNDENLPTRKQPFATGTNGSEADPSRGVV
jgi:hypothetical protein